MNPETVAMLEIQGKQLPLCAGRNYLVGKKAEGSDKLDLELQSESLDSKHALIRIDDNKTKILDLYSTTGTFLNEQRLDGLKEVTLEGSGNLQFGTVVGTIRFIRKIESHESSGFHDGPKNSSEITCSSPEPTSPSSSCLNRMQKDSLTSTPNVFANDMQNLAKTNPSTDKIRKQSNFLLPSVPVRKSNDSNTSRQSFNIPSSGPQSPNSSLANTTDSFCIPETQMCAARTSLPNTSKPDECATNNQNDFDDCIPETQEVQLPCSQQRKKFYDEKAALEANIPKNILECDGDDDMNFGSQFNICTQDLNEINYLAEDTSRDSDLLDDVLSYSLVIPHIKHDPVILNNSGHPTKTPAADVADSTAADDKEMLMLEWSAQDTETVAPNNEESQRADMCTPDLFDLPEWGEQNENGLIESNVNGNSTSSCPKTCAEEASTSSATFKPPSDQTSVPSAKSSDQPVVENDMKAEATQVLTSKAADDKKGTSDKNSPEYLTLSGKENMKPAELAMLQALEDTQITQSCGNTETNKNPQTEKQGESFAGPVSNVDDVTAETTSKIVDNKQPPANTCHQSSTATTENISTAKDEIMPQEGDHIQLTSSRREEARDDDDYLRTQLFSAPEIQTKINCDEELSDSKRTASIPVESNADYSNNSQTHLTAIKENTPQTVAHIHLTCCEREAGPDDDDFSSTQVFSASKTKPPINRDEELSKSKCGSSTPEISIMDCLNNSRPHLTASNENMPHINLTCRRREAGGDDDDFLSTQVFSASKIKPQINRDEEPSTSKCGSSTPEITIKDCLNNSHPHLIARNENMSQTAAHINLTCRRRVARGDDDDFLSTQVFSASKIKPQIKRDEEPSTSKCGSSTPEVSIKDCLNNSHPHLTASNENMPQTAAHINLTCRRRVAGGDDDDFLSTQVFSAPKIKPQINRGEEPSTSKCGSSTPEITIKDCLNNSHPHLIARNENMSQTAAHINLTCRRRVARGDDDDFLSAQVFSASKIKPQINRDEEPSTSKCGSSTREVSIKDCLNNSQPHLTASNENMPQTAAHINLTCRRRVARGDDDDFLSTQVFSASKKKPQINRDEEPSTSKCGSSTREVSIKDCLNNSHPHLTASIENMPQKAAHINLTCRRRVTGGDDDDFLSTQVFSASKIKPQINRDEEPSTSKCESSRPEVSIKYVLNNSHPHLTASNENMPQTAVQIRLTSNRTEGDDDDCVPTQLFSASKIKTKIIESEQPSTSKCSSSLPAASALNHISNPETPIAAMTENSPKKFDDKEFTKPVGLLTKKQSPGPSNASISESPDIDMLLCTPQLISDNFNMDKYHVAQHKLLFGDISDDEDSDVPINKRQISDDFDRLLPHLKERCTRRREDMESKMHLYNRSIARTAEAEKVKLKSSAILRRVTRSRDERHEARDRQRDQVSESEAKNNHEVEKKPNRAVRGAKVTTDTKLPSTQDLKTGRKRRNHERNGIKSKELSKRETEDKIEKADKGERTEKNSIKKKDVSKTTPSKQQITASAKSKTRLEDAAKPVTTKHNQLSAKTSLERIVRRSTRLKSQSESSMHEAPPQPSPPPRRTTRLQSRAEELKLKATVKEAPSTSTVDTKARSSRQPKVTAKSEKTNILDKDPPPKRSKSARSISQETNDEGAVKLASTSEAETTHFCGSGDSRKVSSQTSESSTSSVQRSRTGRKIKVSMTMVDLEHFESLSKNSPEIWTVATDPTESDILIMDKGNRTFKFLVAMARGIPIVNSSWLECVNKNRDIVSMSEHFYSDVEFEKRYKFSLLKSIDLARKQKLFRGFGFFMTPGIRPQPQEMKVIIECAGGTVHTDAPPKGDRQKLYLISTASDQKLWHKYRRLTNGICIISSEGIMAAVMRQSLKPLDYHTLA